MTIFDGLRRLTIAITLLLAFDLAPADSAPATPLVIVFESNAGFASGTNPGLISMWIDDSVNKRTSKHVDSFRQHTQSADVTKLVGETLACVGLPSDASACREVIVVSLPQNARSEEAGLAKELGDRAIARAMVAKVLLRYTANTYSSRVILDDVAAADGKLKLARLARVAYVTRVPKELAAQAKESPERLDEYWLTGDEPRLLQELKASMADIKEMLAVVSSAGSQNWKSLPKVNDLRVPDRFKCAGMACIGVRVLKDTPTRVWLVLPQSLTPQSQGEIVSLDANAAAFAANMGWLAGANN